MAHLLYCSFNSTAMFDDVLSRWNEENHHKDSCTVIIALSTSAQHWYWNTDTSGISLPTIHGMLHLRRQEMQILWVLLIIVSCTRYCSSSQPKDLIPCETMVSKSQSSIYHLRQIEHWNWFANHTITEFAGLWRFIFALMQNFVKLWVLHKSLGCSFPRQVVSLLRGERLRLIR